MFVLGIQGSPRKNGNCEYLLSAFLKECETRGARTETIRPHNLDIGPCKELIVCEKKGFCPIRDQMEELGYEKIRQADVVVLASPVFFYGVTAQVKVFIDRCQMFWGRKYKLRL
ncbi:MAG: flavodoxin family protein, partial [Desulfobacterales bacterium]|nr:flavodoxin family protein [Desulfobacterales bacterium]